VFVEDYSFVCDFHIYIFGLAPGEEADSESGKQDEDAEEEIIEEEGQYSAPYGNDAQYPIPIIRSAIVMVLRRLPFDYSF
jgi:hypothetical protein